MFSLICAGLNRWVDNSEACDLIRHRAHYDVTVMELKASSMEKEGTAVLGKIKHYLRRENTASKRLLFYCEIFGNIKIHMHRVGFLPSKTCFFRTKWKKLDKTCFVQFLPSKTVQNRPKLDETMDSLVKMVILLNYISTNQGLSTKPLLMIMLLKYPIAQTLIAQAMGHFSFAEMPSSN